MAAAGVNWVFDQTLDEGAAALLEAVQLCVELGLDVNAVNSMGLTALHGAANRGSDDIIRFLVEQGREARREGQGRAHAADVGGRRLPRHASGAAEADLDRAAQAADRRHAVRHDPLNETAACSSRRLGRRSRGRRRPVGRAGAGRLAPMPADRACRASAGARGRPRAGATVRAGAPRRRRRRRSSSRTAPPATTSAPRPAGSCSTPEVSITSAPIPRSWEKVVRKIKTGMMPPSGAPRPEPRRARRASPPALEARLDRANPPGAHPDAPALHRLNRTEYANAIRDLLALDVDVDAAAAGRRLERGLRQHRRGAHGVAVAHPGLRLGGDEDQPPGGRRSHAGAVAGHLLRRPAGWRRTSTSTGCRSARAAACS